MAFGPRLMKTLLGIVLWIASVAALTNNNNVAVRVCQNKHCCKRAAKDVDVLQTLNNLLVRQQQDDDDRPSVNVEGVSCLSHCDMGPNIEVKLPNGTSVLVHGNVDAQQSAAQLYELASVAAGEQDTAAATPPVYSPPKILLAASKVMETSQQLRSLDERIRYLTSVITKLESSSPYAQSAANAHAHALRAQACLETSESEKKDTEMLPKAISDAQYVTRDLATVASETTLKKAYRSWVDAETLLASRTKADLSKALAVLQEWYDAQPNFRSKLQKEIEDLQRRRR